MVINTHPDADHLAGLPPLLDRYMVSQILVTDIGTNSELYRQWESQLAQTQLRPTVGGRDGYPGQRHHRYPVDARSGHREGEIRQQSFYCAVVGVGTGQLLLTGDIEPVERNLVFLRARR
ncbi:MAG: MBL fold metallo-hydrolase [Anaerolineae bacterium]